MRVPNTDEPRLICADNRRSCYRGHTVEANEGGVRRSVRPAACAPEPDLPSGRLHSIRPMRKHIQPEPEEFATDSPLEGMRFEPLVPGENVMSG